MSNPATGLDKVSHPGVKHGVKLPVKTDPLPVQPITSLQATQEQYMLLLFLPIIKGLATSLAGQTAKLVAQDVPPDIRAATGVHYFMIHGVPSGAASTLPVPTFQAPEGKDLFVVMSLYDRPFGPYISAFTAIQPIADGLNAVLQAMDETGIIEPTDPTSAAFILANGGVFQNSDAFISLLMRYNFADPTIPAATSPTNNLTPHATPKYFLGATFPGLTVGSILQSYPDAGALWPNPPVPITFN